MKALSIRPHWAHAIIHLGKTVENRTWPTSYRGSLLIHASKGLKAAEFQALQKACKYRRLSCPERGDISAGGLIGRVELVGAVDHSRSSWFEGPIGWELQDPRPIAFVALNGQLRLFDVPDRLIRRLAL